MPNKFKSIEELIDKANNIHNNKYNYKNATSTAVTSKIEIICPLHGSFIQEVRLHLKGAGCPACGRESQHSKRKTQEEDFIKKSNNVHEYKYKYPRTKIINLHHKCIVTCNVHGDFHIAPLKHLKGQGCQGCKKEQKTKKEKIKKMLLFYFLGKFIIQYMIIQNQTILMAEQK